MHDYNGDARDKGEAELRTRAGNAKEMKKL